MQDDMEASIREGLRYERRGQDDKNEAKCNGEDEEESGSSFCAKGGRAGKGGGNPEKQPSYQKNEGLHGPGPAEVQEDARVHS